MENVIIAIMLTAVAGLSTGIGGIIAFFFKNKDTKFLAFTLGVSAGVMVYVSFAELLAKATDTLGSSYGIKPGAIITGGMFFLGVAIAAAIDRLVPDVNISENITEKKGKNKESLFRTGLVTALIMGVHNFPEGMATFVSALQSPVMAIPIVAAIAVHNIPEGIAVAVPIYYATGSRRRAFWYALISGLAEPLGAIIGYLMLMPYIGPVTNAFVFAAVAGIMVFISIDEILPSARNYETGHISVYGFVAGMFVMAVSLIGFM